MVYTERTKLTIYQVVRDNDDVYFSELDPLIMDRPSNMIYCEKNGCLYGLISMGDIRRACEAKKSVITINKKFTYVTEKEYMRVKNVFKENDKIHALPVTDERGVLLGDYTVWDDRLFLNESLYFVKKEFITKFIQEKERIALVMPYDGFKWKKELTDQWFYTFKSLGIWVEMIRHEFVRDAFSNYDYVIFADEDEKGGIGTLFECIRKQDFKWRKVLTYKSLRNAVLDVFKNDIGEKVGDIILESVQKSGVHVLAIRASDNGSEYWKNLQDSVSKRFDMIGQKKRTNQLFDTWKEDFFCELFSEEYATDILSHGFEIVHSAGVTKLKDVKSHFYNVIDGERLTVGQPDKYSKSIYFYGQCVCVGEKVEDGHTIESWLQKKLNDDHKDIRVINYGCWSDQLSQLNRIVSTKYHQGDIIVVYLANRKCHGVSNLNLTNACEKNNVPMEWMVDSPLHANYKVNSIFANAIYDALEEKINENVCADREIDLNISSFVEAYIAQYFTDLCENTHNKTGAIVMNCNPFTNGHRYLIEQALKQVDNLIIFVVEENRSIFTFEERFTMVSEGVKDLENVIVVPSGQFILSQTTFPEYFLKIADEAIVHNVEYDITMFAKQIAPKLNITYRFIGEEPEDLITNEYNKAMKRILPKNGINIVEIPRKQIENQIISASEVRKCLETGNKNRLEKLVPESTMRILFMKSE